MHLSLLLHTVHRVNFGAKVIWQDNEGQVTFSLYLSPINFDLSQVIGLILLFEIKL